MPKFTANLSLLFTEHAWPKRFQTAKRAGFNAVEIQFPYHLNVDALRTILDDLNLKLVLFNVDADDLLQGGEGLACVPEKQDTFRHAVEQALAYADILKPEAINVLPGRCLNPDREQAYLQTFKDNLYFAADAFAPLGVKTVFEAINTHDMPGFIIHNSGQMQAILSELNHPNVLMQYDIYHMQMMGENPAVFIAAKAPRIGHIQFADCPGRHQPGTGEIDFEKLFAVIDSSDYAGWVGAEYKPYYLTEDSLDWLSTMHPSG